MTAEAAHRIATAGGAALSAAAVIWVIARVAWELRQKNGGRR